MIELINVQRERPNRYRADLVVDGIICGRVERGWTQGGRGAKTYVAQVEGLAVAGGRTLADLREELDEWVRDERLMEHDAVWLRMRRERMAEYEDIAEKARAKKPEWSRVSVTQVVAVLNGTAMIATTGGGVTPELRDFVLEAM